MNRKQVFLAFHIILVVLLNYQNVIDILKKKNGNKLLLNGTGVEQMGKS
nr:MAG TPA: hypothetical protein [Caudoviricetes sp.]